MYSKMSLNGEWMLTGKKPDGTEIRVSAKVPGYVHPALEQAGILPPLYWRTNAEQCQWPEEMEWAFSRSFVLEEDQDLSNAWLRFGGIDTYADVYLNNELIYHSSNMFIPFEVKAAQWLKYGENTIRVVIHPYKPQIEGKSLDYSAAFNTERVHVRRIQCTFFWDWVNRFVSAGIWRDVELVFTEKAQIREVYVQTADICETSASIRLRIAAEDALAQNCRFQVLILDPEGCEVWKTQGRVYWNTLRLQADIRDPKLWWPNGYGEHPLYTIKVRLLDEDGQELKELA